MLTPHEGVRAIFIKTLDASSFSSLTIQEEQADSTHSGKGVRLGKGLFCDVWMMGRFPKGNCVIFGIVTYKLACEVASANVR